MEIKVLNPACVLLCTNEEVYKVTIDGFQTYLRKEVYDAVQEGKYVFKVLEGSLVLYAENNDIISVKEITTLNSVVSYY